MVYQSRGRRYIQKGAKRMVRKKIVPNEQKLRELIVYIAAKCAADETFGAMKLNKLLVLADFLAYGRLGRPITGVEYMKLENGPVPRRMKPVRDEMVGKGDIAIEERPYRNMPNPQTRIVPLRQAKLDLLEKEDISLVDDLIRTTWGASGTDGSELTHGYRGWLMARQLRDKIPYSAVFLSDEPPTEYEIKHAEELIREHGWAV
jgi:hypothetical protein